MSTVNSPESTLPHAMDRGVAISAMLVPIGLVLGNVGFEAAVGLTGLLWIIRNIIVSKGFVGRVSKQALLLPLLVWMGAILASRILNGFTAYQFFHDLAFVRYILFVLAVCDVSLRLPMNRYLLIALVAGILWAALNAMSAHMIGYDLIGKPLSRYSIKLKEAARIAAMCSYAAPFFVVWLLFDRKTPRVKQLLIVLLIGVIMVLIWKMHVRTAMLGLLIGLLGGVVVHLKKPLKWIVLSGIAVLAVAVGATIIYTDYPLDLRSFHIRMHIWEVCWQLWLDNPLLGVGISSFQEAYHQLAVSGAVTPYVEPNGAVHDLTVVSHAHNLFVQLLSSTGLLGLAGFAWLVIAAIRRWKMNTTAWRAGLCTSPFVLVGISITGWNIYDAFYTSLVVYFIAWMGCASVIAEPSATSKSSDGNG